MVFNPIKRSGHFMYYCVQHLVILRPAHTMYLCVFMDLGTNSDYFITQHKLTGFYNRDGVC
jgi:hypothetical protein